MDPNQVPVPFMKRSMASRQRESWLAGSVALLVLALAAGCGSRHSSKRGGLGKAVRKELGIGKAKDPGSTIVVQGNNNKFSVEDEDGLPLLEAQSATVEGQVVGGAGLDSPVHLKGVKALLYQHGKKSLTFESPEAVWDPNKNTLSTDKSMHGVTQDNPDRPTIIDGQKTIWTAATKAKKGQPKTAEKPARLELETAHLQQMNKGNLEFTAEGPHAVVVGSMTEMDRGAHGSNPDGQEITANHVLWNKDTHKLDAEGHVVVVDSGKGTAAGSKKNGKNAPSTGTAEAAAVKPASSKTALGKTTLLGDVLHSDTKLNKGKLSGHTRVITTSGKPSGR